MNLAKAAPRSAKDRDTHGVVVLSSAFVSFAAALMLVQALTLLFVALALHQTLATRTSGNATALLLQASSGVDVHATGLSGATQPGTVAPATAGTGEAGSAECFMGGIYAQAKVPVPRGAEGAPFPHLVSDGGALFPPGFVPFSELLCRSKCEKRDHYFGHMYGEYLDPVRLQQRPVNMLEIGLKQGQSLNLWLAAFSRGKIYGLDAFYSDPRAELKASPRVDASRVQIFQGDQENATRLQEIVRHIQAEVGQLDMVVDDGGHTMGQQLASFLHLFPLVKPGGLYFIEDLQTSYWERTCNWYYNGQKYCYGGGPPRANNTTIDLIKSMVDGLNADFVEDHADVFHIGTGVYKVHPLDRLVGSVQCWRNMCVLRRKFEGTYF